MANPRFKTMGKDCACDGGGFPLPCCGDAFFSYTAIKMTVTGLGAYSGCSFPPDQSPVTGTGGCNWSANFTIFSSNCKIGGGPLGPSDPILIWSGNVGCGLLGGFGGDTTKFQYHFSIDGLITFQQGDFVILSYSPFHAIASTADMQMEITE